MAEWGITALFVLGYVVARKLWAIHRTLRYILVELRRLSWTSLDDFEKKAWRTQKAWMDAGPLE